MITTYAWFGYNLPMKESLELIKRAGFDGVTLWWSVDFGRTDFRDAPDLVRRAGLFVENIHAPFEGINNLWLDTLDGDTLTDYFLQSVDDCAEYQMPAMVLHLSGGSRPPPFNELGLDRFKRIVERAEKRGVSVAFENLRKPEYLDYVLSRIDSPRAGFCYDSGHHHCYTPDEDFFAKHGSRLKALHLHDNDGGGDRHRLPFDGTIDWAAVMKQISQAGYKGAVAMEAQNLGYESLPPEAFLRLLFERAERLQKIMKEWDTP
ncbi:MAG: sugar phosphate isomerase/epimerase [Oscillospiraceae bacterium]|nr:sugar phosphate isomerase/epimerase [Oscillospiraceae bacterium]